MRRIFLLVVMVACHKTPLEPPVPPDEPGTGAPLDVETAADIAEMTGTEPDATRCTDMKLDLQVVKDPTGKPRFQATLINGSQSTFALVNPGDGSTSGARTPVITWKVTTLHGDVVPPVRGGRFCGNMNEPKESELFRMKPGARHALSGWIETPSVERGRYLVRLTYENDPRRTPRDGDELRPLQERMRRTTPCKVESNAVTAVINGG